MISIQHVTAIKYGQQLFQDFNWTIRAGEHWVISGENGSGKSLLLELLAGKLQRSQGKVTYDFIREQDWDGYFKALHEKIQYVPAHAGHQLLRRHEGVFYQQRYYGSFNEDIPNVEEVFGPRLPQLKKLKLPESLSIDALLALPLTRLSNGQIKKVLIIKHLLEKSPRLLLLDYPFEGLDDQSRIDFSHFLDYVVKYHGLVLVLTDHYHDLPKVINRRLTLKNFRILSQEAIQHPDQAPGTAHEPKPLQDSPLMDSAPPVIEINKLCIQYGEKIIFNDFNWTVRQGERWALTGPNGSGKTTLFSLINADHPMAYSQEVSLFGKRRGSGESIWDIKERIHYLGPEVLSYLNPKYIREKAIDFIRDKQPQLDEEAMQQLLDFFQAGNWVNLPVRQLSSGQLQLVLLLKCFLTKKELILLDEPFQFLDPQHKAKVSEYLQNYLDKDKTLLLITHYSEDIERWTQQHMQLG